MGANERPLRTVAVLCGLVVGLSSCGNMDPEPEPPLNSLGTNTRVGEITLRNVYVVAPRDRQYEAGQRVRLRLTLLNDGSRKDALTRVTSEVARTTSLHWDRACDGRAESVDRITVTAGGPVPQDPLPSGSNAIRTTTQQDPLHQPYYVRLRVDEQIRRGTTVPVSFTFERAGAVNVDVLVASGHPKDHQAELACLADGSTG